MRPLLGAICALLVACASASAETYPSRPVTVIVPFPAGGPSDVVARIVTEHMGKVLGETMVIENVGGAGGTIGSARVANAAPDGYTLLAGSMGSHVAAPVLTPSVKYDSARDFQPIGFTAHAPAVIVVRKDFPANNLGEFIAYLKQNAENVKQAHGGIGSSSHMACLLFSLDTGTKPLLVAYRGTGPALNDLAAGIVDAYFGDPATLGVIKGGKARAMAVTSPERWPVLPDTPALAEALPGYEAWNWYGIDAPPGTPNAIVDRLSAAILKVMADPEVKKKYDDNGLHPANLSRADYLAFIKRDSAVWAQVIAKGNIRAEE
jgi:tripartite-type tricarboxylate transporter receptor subunit TctC